MAASTKKSTGWGSFLQQAVAGVESRLDNILAEGDEAAKPSSKPTPPPVASSKIESSNVSRSASTSSRNPDRLQERLAKAMAAKNLAQKGERPDSLALSSVTPSRTGSPITAPDTPRRSLDVDLPHIGPNESSVIVTQPPAAASMDANKEVEEVPAISVQPETPGIEKSAETVERIDDANKLGQSIDVEPSPRLSTESIRSQKPRESVESAEPFSRTSLDSNRVESNGLPQPKTIEEYETRLQQLQSDYETSELQRQEEIHDYVEKIDALQSKLQYLAKESAEAARKASGAAPSGSLEKKLADKDEQIALLMEEGQKLSKKELNHMNTIKKLRAKIQENNKEVTSAKAAQEKAERELPVLQEKVKRAEASEKRLVERQRQVVQLQKERDSLRGDRDSRDLVINGLKKQLEEVASQGKQAEAKAANEALEAERKRVKDLEDDLANAKIEKNLASDKAQAQIKELREKSEKDAERARMADLEAKNELHMLEGKLEVMRARAEEVSSGATGDAQAKLLRQIETLQTQYAVASENWQGIEATLLARATALEKERDEATKREADIRKKAREVTLKAKRNEDELEESRSRLPTFQQELNEQRIKLEALQKRADEAELALKEARASFDQEKQAWKAESQRRLDEEKQRWQEDLPPATPSRADSPVTSTRRGLTSEFLGLQNLQLRRASARSVTSDLPSPAVLSGRRSSQQVRGGISSGNGTPIRQDSLQSLAKENGDIAETPSIHAENDDFFDQQSPASPHQTINDMVSASTAAAGPSVQLVERMSSAVRRLESEKVASKEDLARISAQRDEARAEIVSLMREVEVKRAAEEKAKTLEEEVKTLNERYQTTLEMLGEKSEEVDELRSDIEDLKGIYKDLVQRTVK